jgi:RNase P protein component
MFATKVNLKELKKFAKRNKSFDMQGALMQALEAALIEAQSFTAKHHLSAPGRGRAGNKGPWIPNPFDDKLRTLTGRLRADWMANFPRVFRKGRKVVGTLGTNVIYARTHEFDTIGALSEPRAPFSKGVVNSEAIMRERMAKMIVKSMQKHIGYKERKK